MVDLQCRLRPGLQKNGGAQIESKLIRRQACQRNNLAFILRVLCSVNGGTGAAWQFEPGTLTCLTQTGENSGSNCQAALKTKA